MRRFPITESFCTSSKSILPSSLSLRSLRSITFLCSTRTSSGTRTSNFVCSITRLPALTASSFLRPSTTTPSHLHLRASSSGSPTMCIRSRTNLSWLLELLTTTRELLARKFIYARLWMLQALMHTFYLVTSSFLERPSRLLTSTATLSTNAPSASWAFAWITLSNT